MAHAQYVRSCGKVSPLTPQGAASQTDALGRPYTGSAYFEFIPSLCTSERYDSNVFYAPKTPGVQRDDFVTDVNPQLRVNHNGEYLTGYLDIGGFYESYARNSDLNFFGTADSLFLNLDNSIKRLLPNASFIITDSVRYTPTPPGFVNPIAGASPSSPANLQNSYAQGLLSYRTNNLTNTLSALASYSLTPTTTLNASYTNSFLKFGSSQLSPGIVLFDSTTHAGTMGVSTKVTSLDTMALSYSHNEFTFKPSSSTASTSSTGSGTFKSNTAILTWTRNLTPYLTTTIGGGGIVIDPGITTYALNAALVLATPNNTATISYSRSAQPGFIGVGVPVISDSVTLSALQKLALQWELSETAGYTHASSADDPASVRFDSYYAAVDLYYWITKIWSTALSVDYMKFDQTFTGTEVNWDRYTVTLSLKATFN
jgi:hypothetical protein